LCSTNSEALVAERSQRARGAGKADHQHALAQFGQAFLVPIEHRQPDRGLVAEGHRQRLLQVRAPGHRRVAVLVRQIGQDAAQLADVCVDEVDRGADLQHVGRVHDVLRGGTPMDVAAGLAGHRDQLVHQRQDRVADDVGFLTHVIEVDAIQPRLAGDHVGCFGRDHTAARFGARQSNFDFDVAPDQSAVREDLAHARCAEGIAEQDGVDDGAGALKDRVAGDGHWGLRYVDKNRTYMYVRTIRL
jgi:hypothetical protein